MDRTIVGAKLSSDGKSERMIPISVVTGFLGSGKTTLISRILRDPSLSQTAVIVNEFGEIGLDHDLIVSSEDTILTLITGCVCCAIQTDLGRTLMALWERRASGVISYDRVLIETSGLSDPTPVLHSLMTDARVHATHQMAYIVTIIDSVHGEITIRKHVEARHQIMMADRLLVSKTDLQPVSNALATFLETLNPGLAWLVVNDVAPCDLFGSSSRRTSDPIDAQMPKRTVPAEIAAVTVTRDRPIPAVVLTLFLQAVAEHCGRRLLRLKGLVSIAEVPGRPAVVHGVRHVINPPEFLDRWPNADETTRLVLIMQEIPRYFLTRLLDAIEEEVLEEVAALPSKLLSAKDRESFVRTN